ncbi:hypothetical protein pb186bvf_014399 [Paramecium bursaria]
MEGQTHKSTSQIVFMMTNAVLGAFYFGYAVSYMNPAMNTAQHQFEFVDSPQVNVIKGVLNALPAIGAAFGAISSGPMLSSFTIRQSMIITDCIGILGSGLQLIIQLPFLYAARFVLGVAVGLNSSLVPQYINLFSPKDLSGSLGAMNQMMINLGVLTGLAFGLGFDEDGTEKSYMLFVFDFGMLACALRTCFLLLIYTDEPPQYYLKIGDNQQAKHVLCTLYKTEHVNEILERLNQETKSNLSKRQSYSDCLRNPVIYPRVIIGSVLSLIQQFSGINAILIYSSGIFKESFSEETKNILNIAVGLTNLTFSILAIPLLNKFGRRPLLLYGTIYCSITLLVIGVFGSDQKGNGLIISIFMFLYLAGFQFSLGPVVWIYISDILPEKGVSIAVLANWIGCAIVAQFFLLLQDSAGFSGCFFIFGGFCVLGAIFIFFRVKETKDRSADTIENMYSLVNKVEDQNY